MVQSSSLARFDCSEQRYRVENGPTTPEARRKNTGAGQRVAKTGEPTARSRLGNYPRPEYGKITDQFTLGASLLVAPAFQQGTWSHPATFPPDTWPGDDKSKVTGQTVQTIQIPLARLTYLTRQ